MKFINTNELVSLEEIKEFESKFEIKLPEEYVNHVLENNGGYPENPIFINATDEYQISWFYSIKNGSESNLLSCVYPMLEDVLPKDMFPICDGPSGSNFCINLSDGKIYFIAYDMGEIIPELVADSLNELIKGLIPE